MRINKIIERLKKNLKKLRESAETDWDVGYNAGYKKAIEDLEELQF